MAVFLAALFVLVTALVATGDDTAGAVEPDTTANVVSVEQQAAIDKATAPERPVHTNSEETRAICTYIEALRFGLNPNNIVWTNCAELHLWNEHQVGVRYWSNISWNSYCVIYDRRGFDPNGTAIPPPCLTGVAGYTGG
jgi:hypothetical protein